MYFRFSDGELEGVADLVPAVRVRLFCQYSSHQLHPAADLGHLAV
jgi:hypothetical protein